MARNNLITVRTGSKAGIKAIVNNITDPTAVGYNNSQILGEPFLATDSKELFIGNGGGSPKVISPGVCVEDFDTLTPQNRANLYVYAYDTSLAADAPRSKKVALSDLNALESVETELTRHNEVYRAEGMLEIPVFFTNEHIKEPVSVIGLRENSNLYTVIDDDKNPVNIYKGGVVLSERLADKLRVKTGDYLTMESPYMRDKDKKERVRVISTVKQNVGINGYMDIEYLSAVLGYSPAANSVLLRAKPNTAAVLKDIYEESPKITGINDTNEMIEKLKKFMGSFMGSMYYVALIAIVMGVAIIYNSYVIILSERKRELSSLMVLGMSEKEVLSIVTFEQWFIAIFAMLFGIPLSQSAVTAMGKSASTDMFSLAVKLDLNSLIIAFVVTIIAIVLAQVMASRKIKHLNIVDALKSNE